jgi:hypothetical protein
MDEDIDGWKKAKASLPQRASDSSKSLAAVEEEARRIEAVKHAIALMASFRKVDAAAPKHFLRVIEDELARYPLAIQALAADPGNWKYPPNAFEIREFCKAEIERRKPSPPSAMDIAIADTLARRQDNASVPREKRETLEEMRKRYPPNWGLSVGVDGPERDEVKEAKLNAQSREIARARVIAAYHREGVDPVITADPEWQLPVSPSLVKQIRNIDERSTLANPRPNKI